MGLLSRSSTPKAAKAVKTSRVAKPRVRLRPEEMKSTNRLTERERYITYGLAAFAVGAFLFRTVGDGLIDREPVWLGLGVALALFLAGLGRFTNRLGVTLGAVGCALWPGYGRSWAILAYPFLGFTMYLTFAMKRSRDKLMSERAAKGDFADPFAEKRAAKGKPVAAKEDALGRAYASQSKRYTPPKAVKKK